MKKVNLIKTLLLLFVFFITTSVTVNGQITSKEIDQLVERTMKAFDVPGIAVAVIKDGKIVHSKGYGVNSLNTKEKVDPQTLFGIASNSKAFTTASIALLVEDKKLDWDDKVIDYIPEFRMYNSYVTEEFTIRDLLTHRSGLGLGAGDLMHFPDSTDFSINDLIHNLRYLKPTSGFRSKFDYDNLLYMVAGEVVARVSGKSWETFVEERILKPLEMNRSAASYEGLKDKTNVIDGHAPVNGQVKVVRRHIMKEGENAAGGIYSSIADMSNWIITLLEGGKYGSGFSKQLFSEKILEEMWSSQTILGVRKDKYNSHFHSYGLGWFLSDVKGYKQVMHTGGLEGMVTQVTMLPEMKLGIIVLTNQQSSAAFLSVTNTIKDSYLKIEKEDWVAKYDSLVKKSTARAEKINDEIWNDINASLKSGSGKVDLTIYSGHYKDNWLGEIEISKRNENLWFQSRRSPKLQGEMFFYKGNTFVVKWVDRSMDADAFVMFTLNKDGKGDKITMKAISPLTDFSYDFHDLDFYRIEKKR